MTSSGFGMNAEWRAQKRREVQGCLPLPTVYSLPSPDLQQRSKAAAKAAELQAETHMAAPPRTTVQV